MGSHYQHGHGIQRFDFLCLRLFSTAADGRKKRTPELEYPNTFPFFACNSFHPRHTLSLLPTKAFHVRDGEPPPEGWMNRIPQGRGCPVSRDSLTATGGRDPTPSRPRPDARVGQEADRSQTVGSFARSSGGGALSMSAPGAVRLARRCHEWHLAIEPPDLRAPAYCGIWTTSATNTSKRQSIWAQGIPVLST